MCRRIRFAISLLLLILVLASCSAAFLSEPSGESYMTFTDDCGNEITLFVKPQKTAVLFSSFADVFRLSGGEISITVGETVERGIAPEGTPLVDEGAGKTINTELLISFAPDFVICSADIAAQVEAAALLNSVGIPAACFRIETFDDYLRTLRTLTRVTGNEAAYEAYGNGVKEQIDSLLSTVPREDEPKRILFIRAGSSARSTKAKTAEEHFACVMLNDLGTYNIAENAKVLLDGLSIEEIMREDPDLIFISTMGDEDAAKAYIETLFAQETYQTLSAVKNGRYYFLPKTYFQYKPNAAWYEAYRYLAELIYGNLEQAES